MTILISKSNKDIIKDVLPEVEFQDCTEDTYLFKMPYGQFMIVESKLKNRGYNPSELMKTF